MANDALNVEKSEKGRATVWILGDQLMHLHPALVEREQANTVVLMVESKARGAMHPYHQQKLVLVYSAMRHFAADLRKAGWRVDYIELGEGLGFEAAARRHVSHFSPGRVVMAEPNSFRERDVMQKLGKKLGLKFEFLETTQFLCGREEFQQWAGEKPRLLMENHYRRMRKKTGYLVRQGRAGGRAMEF